MTEREWLLSRELEQTKLTLYSVQTAYLQLAAERVQAALAALGDKWEEPKSGTPTESQPI